MNMPVLYRRRFIPEETVCLKDDRILSYGDSLIITSWNTLKPRHDIARGVSAYFINEGFKISKIYDSKGELVYWYCDIIQVRKEPASDQIIFEDLLLDIIVYPDGTVRLVDMDELADALESGLITLSMGTAALRTSDHLLRQIRSGEFERYQAAINRAEQDSTL